MPTPRNPTGLFLVIVLIASLIQACGVPGPGGGRKKNTSDADPSPAEIISIRVEATDQMLASWQRSLYHLLTPKHALALTGLSERSSLSENQISVVSLDHNFQESNVSPTPEYQVRKKTSGSGYEIQFNALYEEQINRVVKVTLSNTQVLYAPLYTQANENEAITVNVASHYVLQKLFEEIDTAEKLQQMLPCDSSDDCPTQHEVKSALLANLSELVQDFDIDVPNSSTISSALDLLDENRDLRRHVETAAREITREALIDNLGNTAFSPIAKGTKRSFGLTDGDLLSQLNYNQEYNSVWFSLFMDDVLPFPSNSQNEIAIAAASSKIVTKEELGSAFPAYPYFNQNTSLLEIRRDTLSSDIPFTRTALIIDETNRFSLDTSEPTNSFSFGISDTFLSNQGFLLADHNTLQSILKPDVGAELGWSANPTFSKYYLANDYEPDTSPSSGGASDERPDYGASPTWLLNANYNAGGVYLDTDSDPSKFSRGAKQEALNMFTWEIHSLETDSNFSDNVLSGTDYGVISLSLKLAATNEVLSLFAETSEWNAQGGLMRESNAETKTLVRSSDNTVTGVNTVADQSMGDQDYFDIETERATREHPTGISENRGLIGLNGGAQAPYGHATQDGKHLAFALNTDERGRGLIIATELREVSAEPVFNGEWYQLQGHTMGMLTSRNFITNLNGSRLQIEDRIPSDPADIDCHAELFPETLTLEHNINTNVLNPPSISTPSTIQSSACRLDGGRIELEFANFDGQALLLKGFVSVQDEALSNDTTPGEVINLIWSQADNLGLVFALKEQVLAPEFDE